MNERIQLALEAGISKLAQETPGAFPLSQPYGMADRVRRALGISGKQNKGLPGMVGTVASGATTGTASGMPKGMGKAGPAAPANVSSPVSKMGQAGPLGTPPTMKPLIGGTKAVRPQMNVLAKPAPTKPENVSLGSAYPGPREMLEALGYGPELKVAAMISKEGCEDRARRALLALDELEAAKTAGEKLPALLKLAGIRQESIDAAALKMALLL